MTEQSTQVENYFSEKSGDWHDLYIEPRSANDLVLQNRKELALRMVQTYAPKEGSVLDAGCGAGLLSAHLAREGYKVHGVDISASMIDICKKQFAKEFTENHPHRFSVGDLKELNLEGETFDAITAMGFIEYQENEAAMLDHLYSLLKPKGLLVISGPKKMSISRIMASAYSKVLRKKDQRPSISIHLYGKSRFKKLLEGAGFEVTNVFSHGFAGFPILGGGRKGMLIHKCLTGISKVLPINVFANDILVAARKRDN